MINKKIWLGEGVNNKCYVQKGPNFSFSITCIDKVGSHREVGKANLKINEIKTPDNMACRAALAITNKMYP